MGGYALLWNSRACFLNHNEDFVWATMVLYTMRLGHTHQYMGVIE